MPFPTALSMLLSSYVEAINSGRLPCLEGAAAAMMANENAAAVTAALEAYARGMRGLSLPTEPAQLSASHGEHLREALVVFQRRSFRDPDQEHQRRLMVHGHPPLVPQHCPCPCSYPYKAALVFTTLSPFPQCTPLPSPHVPLTPLLYMCSHQHSPHQHHDPVPLLSLRNRSARSTAASRRRTMQHHGGAARRCWLSWHGH